MFRTVLYGNLKKWKKCIINSLEASASSKTVTKNHSGRFAQYLSSCNIFKWNQWSQPFQRSKIWPQLGISSIGRRTQRSIFWRKYTSVYVCRWTRCLVDVVFGPVATHECVVNAWKHCNQIGIITNARCDFLRAFWRQWEGLNFKFSEFFIFSMFRTVLYGNLKKWKNIYNL